VGVALHDVPQDGVAAYLHHRLGADGGFFTEPGAKTTGKDNGLHKTTLKSIFGIRITFNDCSCGFS
jgi:hypothetical protein